MRQKSRIPIPSCEKANRTWNFKTIPINGLSFATRCQYADGECKKSLPPLRIFEEGTGKGASMSGAGSQHERKV